MANSNHSIDIGEKTTQQIALWSGILGAAAAIIVTDSASGVNNSNPLVIGLIGFAVSFSLSLFKRAFGIGIIIISSLIILKSCGTMDSGTPPPVNP